MFSLGYQLSPAQRRGVEACCFGTLGRLWFCCWQNGAVVGQRNPKRQAAVLLLFEPVPIGLLSGHLWATVPASISRRAASRRGGLGLD